MAENARHGEHQKQKLLYLAKLFTEKIDAQHALSTMEIIERLVDCGVNADRKTLYLDFVELQDFGVGIEAVKVGRNTLYRLSSRRFELLELKLLVDSVQSAKSITDKKSRELIAKLESLVSRYEAIQLQCQVVISDRVKTVNTSVYYNVDAIHEAINASCQIRFKYFQWNLKKETKPRRNGVWYQTSPWALAWDSKYYYLVAYEAESGRIKHHHVDKMKRISVVEDRRQGLKRFRQFNTARYSKSLFGMNGGKETVMTLEASNEKVGILIDRFRKDIPITPIDGGHFRCHVTVAMSLLFLGWIIGLGGDVKIVVPQAVVDRMTPEVQRLAAQYPQKEP